MDTTERARALLTNNPDSENAALIRDLLELFEGERETRISALRQTQDLRDELRWKEAEIKELKGNSPDPMAVAEQTMIIEMTREGARLKNADHLPESAKQMLTGMVNLAYRIHSR